MDLWIETLLKSKEGLHSLHPSAIEWADKEGVLYAFNTAGDLLAVRNKQIFFTKDGDLSSETYWDGRKKSFLSEQSEKRAALTFIPDSLTFEKYKDRPYLFKGEFPLPGDFIPKAIDCQEDVFSILSQSEANALSGTFSVFQISLSMVESLYFNQGVSEETLCQCYYEFLPKDHQNFLARQETERKRWQNQVSATQSPLIRAEDFSTEDSEYNWEGELLIWGERADLYFNYVESEESAATGFPAVWGQLNQHLEWIEQHKVELFYAILADGIARLACDWMDGCDLVEKDGNSYYVLDDEELFPYPVTNESLFESLYLEGMDACYYDKKDKSPDEILFDMFFGTNPDFFACHSIEVFLTAYSDGRYQIKVNGLAG
ncbi:MAG: hypothetical protein HFI40_06695 [Lachnospiraceae bacterium]|jgi:hypothetical protein|nr:hypothetical protein [Lachnospiraceae bacterium]